MKQLTKYIAVACTTLAMGLNFTACTDYLDKTPESDISSTEAYKDFQNFQGFTEELYNCIPDFAKGYWTNSWNWGEDELQNVGINYHMVYKIDQGDFWGWQSEFDGWQSGWMDRNSFNPGGDRFAKSLWKGAWYGIRKANMGLENLSLINATQEEKNLIAGQLYFFRGWFHFELIQYFGGLPYINRVLPSDQQLREPRISYQAIADSIARDFRKAADLLPVDWDNTAVGKNTVGKNQLRVSKLAALGYLGKNYLYAGSPLMNKESQGSPTYNKEYCKKAAEAFGELLAMVEGGQTKYGLLPFSEYSANFYTIDQNGKIPGENKDNTITEAIFRGPSYAWNDTNWGLSKQFGIKRLTDSGVRTMPTANYVNYYGMANGLPLTDAESGFDKSHPWKGRDPRFYHDIVYDGVKVVKGTLKAEDEPYRYAALYTGGNARDVIEGSRTGYLLYKFIDVTCNKNDDGYGWSHHFHIHLPWMRLADVYLMYAEAAAQATGNPSGQVGNCPLNALQAVNKIRARAGVADVAAKYTADLEGFMSELRRERAVELAYEGHRFNDLRRWLLLDKSPYNIKTSQEFERVGSINTADPTQNQVSGFTEKLILKRDFTEKHYWLPLKKSDTSMYPEFYQNPGW
jgi:hypothetical protein